MRLMNAIEAAEADQAAVVEEPITAALVVRAAVQAEGDDPPAPPAPAAPKQARSQRRDQVNMPLLWIWLLLFGFVGTQLGWTLRPFFGSPGVQFEVFRALEGNFYANVAQTLIRLVR
jgi:hypothetical protein